MPPTSWVCAWAWSVSDIKAQEWVAGLKEEAVKARLFKSGGPKL